MDQQQVKRRRIDYEAGFGHEVAPQGQQQNRAFGFEPGVSILCSIEPDTIPYSESSSAVCLAPCLLENSCADPSWPDYTDVPAGQVDQTCIPDAFQFGQFTTIPLPPLTDPAWNQDMPYLTETVQPINDDLVCFGRVSSISSRYF